jgi:putative peptidoglycan lipid II flippase
VEVIGNPSGNSTNGKILRAGLSLFSGRLLVRAASLGLQVVVTYRYGIGTDTDAYNSLYLLITTLAQLIAGGLDAAVIPVLARAQMRSQAYLSALFSTVLNALILLLCACSFALYIFRSQIVIVAAPGLLHAHEVMTLAVSIAPYLIPVLSLITVIAFLETMLNARGEFGWPACAAALAPISTAAVLLAWNYLPIAALTHDILVLCIGNLIGLTLHLGAVIIRIYKAGLRYKLQLNLKDPNVQTIARLSVAPVCAALMASIGPVVDQQIASIVGGGTITALSYANRVANIFIFIVFSSVAQAVLPHLAKQAVESTALFKKTLRLYVWVLGCVAIAFALTLVLFAQPLVQMLFQRGRFSVQATEQVAWIITGLTIGLPAAAILNLMERALTALQNTRVLVVTTTAFLICNVALDIGLGLIWGGFGIALATSLAYIVKLLTVFALLRMAIGPLHLFVAPPEFLSLFSKLWITLLGTASQVRRGENPFIQFRTMI